MAMTLTVHYRCLNEVSFDDVSDGYSAQCPECYEDLFSFEYGRVTL